MERCLERTFKHLQQQGRLANISGIDARRKANRGGGRRSHRGNDHGHESDEAKVAQSKYVGLADPGGQRKATGW